MSSKYKFRDQDTVYLITFSVVHWIDVFIRNEYKTILLDSWGYCMKHKSLDIYAWCIMTSHVHMIIGSHQKLDAIMHDMKIYTSKSMRNAILSNQQESRKDWMMSLLNQNNRFQFWQNGSHPIALTTPSLFRQKLDYIHDNPVAAGFVEAPENYLYSSARDYHGRKGLIDIKMYHL
ncbi:MAG: transposase [Chitinophagaceae bacterium]|nr:MAG: transposase [Chitinophagaceae bacterium]